MTRGYHQYERPSRLQSKSRNEAPKRICEDQNNRPPWAEPIDQKEQLANVGQTSFRLREILSKKQLSPHKLLLPCQVLPIYLLVVSCPGTREVGDSTFPKGGLNRPSAERLGIEFRLLLRRGCLCQVSVRCFLLIRRWRLHIILCGGQGRGRCDGGHPRGRRGGLIPVCKCRTHHDVFSSLG